MKVVVLSFALSLLFIASKAQSSGPCTGVHENQQAGKEFQRASGGFNPDKIDRPLMEKVRQAACNAHDQGGHPSPSPAERSQPAQPANTERHVSARN